MGIIPINLDDEIIEKIDILVQQGRYKNRSEALRDQIIKNLDKVFILNNPEVNSERYKRLLDVMINLPSPPQFLDTEKTLTELISEDRDR